MTGYEPAQVIEVRAWGRRVGAVAPDPTLGLYVFQYEDEWAGGQVDLAPLHMPNGKHIYSFPGLDEATWKRLPPMLADSLPDDFGNALVDQWMARQGIDSTQVTALDRLAYTADRGMGALTFHPALTDDAVQPTALALADLVTTARQVLRGDLIEGQPAEEALRQLIHVGASAGGARAKAVVAYNPQTGQIRSGQFDAPDGFTQWLVKLDGASAGHDRGAVITEGTDYGRIEYAYHLMALESGIDMTKCQLIDEGPRAHFITRRFDRTESGDRLHMLTLCGLDHTSYKRPATYSYEQLILTTERLGLGPSAAERIFRRCVFNVAAVNRDDHTKNTAFLCTPDGRWSLAPAYDLTHSYKIDSQWVARHQMTVNGKTEDIQIDDFNRMGDRLSIKGYKAIIREVYEAVSRWPVHAAAARVSDDTIERIQADIDDLSPATSKS